MPLSVCFPFHRGFNSKRREFAPREQTLSIKRVNPFREWSTLKCLSIRTPKTINFPFVPNGKLIIFRCPKIWPNYSPVIMCLNFGTLKNC